MEDEGKITEWRAAIDEDTAAAITLRSGKNRLTDVNLLLREACLRRGVAGVEGLTETGEARLDVVGLTPLRPGAGRAWASTRDVGEVELRRRLTVAEARIDELTREAEDFETASDERVFVVSGEPWRTGQKGDPQ